MKWITRSGVKVDRVACPWLIKKFGSPSSSVLGLCSGFVPPYSAGMCTSLSTIFEGEPK